MNGPKRWMLVASGSCIALASACTVDSDEAPVKPSAPPPSSVSRTESPDAGAVVDRAPYWCDLVPKDAFRQVSGITGNLFEHWSARLPDNGTCLVRDQEESGPLGVGWLTDHAREKVSGRLERIRAQVSNDDPVRLPRELGFGFTAYAPGEDDSAPYVAVAAFRCGARKPLIDIDLRRVSAGRDATKDLTDLMRIAQKRFGELYHCSPRPS